MSHALTIGCALAASDRDQALNALRAASIAAEPAPEPTRGLITARFPHHATPPPPQAWAVFERRVREVLVAHHISVHAIRY